MKTYKAQGIVLSTIKYGESSMVAYVLTDVAGRRNYMIQGLGRSTGAKAGKAALFQPMFLIDFVGIESTHTQLDRMREVALSQPLQSIPFDVRKSTIALFMSEVLYRLIKEVEPDSPLFGYVKNSVVALDMLDDGIHNFHLWFLVGLSRHLGFYPSNDFTEGDLFDIQEGAFTHSAPRHPLYLNADNAMLLHRLMCAEVTDLADIRLSRRQRADFIEALLAYFGYHLDTINRIQSLKILSEVF